MFELNDDVWSFTHGWGVIVEIEEQNDYPVVVKLNNGTTVSFTKDGKICCGDPNRSLFFEEIHIPKVALERPRKTAEQMLKECKGITFNKESDEPKYYLYYGARGNVSCEYNVGCRTIGVKYISKEDAERIVFECRENNRG